MSIDQLKAELAACRAENERLRAALLKAGERVLYLATRSGGPAWNDAQSMMMSDFALIGYEIREALTPPSADPHS